MKKIFFGIILLLYMPTHFSQIIQDQMQSQSLLNNATITVTIGGQFPIRGTFQALLTERVDEFVTRMYSEAIDITLRTVTDPELYRKVKEEMTNYSLRGILLKRANGDEMMVDLEKFRINCDFSNNPYLKNDDVIIFPPYDVGRNFFTIIGAVNNPSRFYFVYV